MLGNELASSESDDLVSICLKIEDLLPGGPHLFPAKKKLYCLV